MDRQKFRSYFSFEVLAKLFFDLADERYPSGEKMKQLTGQLVDSFSSDAIENIHLKIGILSLMRNMVKEVSPAQLYRSPQHKEELYAAIIAGLEDFEDQWEELQEQMIEEEDE